MLFTESMMAAAAEPADDCPRAVMIAAPRCWISLRKSPFNQASSPITSVAGRPLMVALLKSGYWVAEWLPQIGMFLTSVTGTFAFLASWNLARFWSNRTIANQRSG